MNYIKWSAGFAGFVSIGLAIAAVAAVIAGVVAVAAVGCFLLLFPLVLMTAPAIKRLAARLNGKLREEEKTKANPDDLAFTPKRDYSA